MKYVRVVKQIWAAVGGGNFAEILRLQSGKQLLEALEENRAQPTIIITEAELPDCNCLTIGCQIRNCDYNCHLIILSHTDKYAVEGYSINVAGYLLKSQATLEQFAQIFLKMLQCAIKNMRQYATFLCNGSYETVSIADISRFEVNNRVITAHHKYISLNFYSTLERIEDEMRDYGFLRVHRKHLVSIRHVGHHRREILTLDCGTRLPVGRSYQKDVAETFQVMRELRLQLRLIPTPLVFYE